MSCVMDQRRTERAAFKGAQQIAASVCCEAEQHDMGSLLTKYIYALCLHLLEAGRSSKPSFSVWFLLFKLVLEALEGAGQNTTWRMGAVSPLQDSWGAWTNPSCLWIGISQCTVTASSAAGVHILAFQTHGSVPSSPPYSQTQEGDSS